jgi:hypothetical protein
VAVALVTVTSTIALVQMRTSIVTLDADKASGLVMSQLQYARQVAVDQRRDVRVEFLSTNRIKVTRVDGGGVFTVLSDVTLPASYVYGKPTGPGDTPEGYGNATAVYFNNDTKGTFLGDGTFVSDAGILSSGTVFTISGGNGTSRAVTLSGATGRIKIYYLQGNTWLIRG